MAGAGFKTFTAGEVFTASDANTYLMQQAVMVFTNEAARDAAITSPSEGMHAYLTAPTVPAATGGSMNTPTGILTIYNGSVWVCTTEVGAYTSNAGTTTSTSYTATLSGSPGTNPSVTLVTGTTALVNVGAIVYANTGVPVMYMGVAISGATTAAASDSFALIHASSNGLAANRQFIVTGLTAGTNTFTLNYRITSNTMNVEARSIIVKGIA